jgi:hypothetical protein
MIGTFRLGSRHAAGKEPLLLVTAEGMGGEDQRNSEHLGDPRGDESGVGVVRVNDVGNIVLPADEADDPVDHFRQMRPEQFLAQILSGTAGDTPQRGALAERFARLTITPIGLGASDHAGDEIDTPYARVAAERPSEIQHVADLSAGIDVHPNLRLIGTDQAVDAHMHNVERRGPVPHAFIQSPNYPVAAGLPISFVLPYQ